MKKLLTLIITLALLTQTARQGYALRPMATAQSATVPPSRAGDAHAGKVSGNHKRITDFTVGRPASEHWTEEIRRLLGFFTRENMRLAAYRYNFVVSSVSPFSAETGRNMGIVKDLLDKAIRLAHLGVEDPRIYNVIRQQGLDFLAGDSSDACAASYRGLNIRVDSAKILTARGERSDEIESALRLIVDLENGEYVESSRRNGDFLVLSTRFCQQTYHLPVSVEIRARALLSELRAEKDELQDLQQTVIIGRIEIIDYLSAMRDSDKVFPVIQDGVWNEHFRVEIMPLNRFLSYLFLDIDKVFGDKRVFLVEMPHDEKGEAFCKTARSYIKGDIVYIFIPEPIIQNGKTANYVERMGYLRANTVHAVGGLLNLPKFVDFYEICVQWIFGGVDVQDGLLDAVKEALRKCGVATTLTDGNEEAMEILRIDAGVRANADLKAPSAEDTNSTDMSIEQLRHRLQQSITSQAIASAA